MSYATSHPAITANLPERDEYLASQNILINKYTELIEKFWNESWLPSFGPESPLFEKQKDTLNQNTLMVIFTGLNLF